MNALYSKDFTRQDETNTTYFCKGVEKSNSYTSIAWIPKVTNILFPHIASNEVSIKLVSSSKMQNKHDLLLLSI